MEHIGSTAVPGLIVKPVLDLAARLKDSPEMTTFESTLPALGYRLRNNAGVDGGRVWLRESEASGPTSCIW